MVLVFGGRDVWDYLIWPVCIKIVYFWGKEDKTTEKQKREGGVVD